MSDQKKQAFSLKASKEELYVIIQTARLAALAERLTYLQKALGDPETNVYDFYAVAKSIPQLGNTIEASCKQFHDL